MRTVLGFALLAVLTSGLEAQGFGRAVAVSGSDVLVGQPDYNKRPGLVYLYQRDAQGRWVERAQLAATDSALGDGFGSSLAVAGDLLLVGGSGAAYVFRRAGGPSRWTQVARLAPAAGTADDQFGGAVALSGELALVGAPAQDSARGAVYAFRRSGDRWEAAGTLTAADRQGGDRFGTALAIAGSRVAVGAPGRERRTGAAYVFAAQGGAWREEGTLPARGLAENSRFGAALATLGDRVMVSAPTHDGFTGAVFVFSRDSSSGSWGELTVFRPFDGTRGTQFGAALAVDGQDVWVGAPGAAGFTGRIYRYGWDANAGEWSAVSKLAGTGTGRGDGFATAVAVAGGLAVAGSGGDDYGAGTAVVFERAAAGAWADRGKLASELVTLAPIAGREVECVNGKAAELFDCREMSIQSFLPVQGIGGRRGVEVNDLWGWTDPETGREYALVGRSDGTSFIDVTDPLRPAYLGDLPMTDSARGSVWRDIKVYKDHAFIVSDGAGPHGMQVFDLTQLRRVSNPPVTFRETAHYYRINSAHNIVINEATGFAYPVGASGGGETCGGGLHMVDVRDPRNPRFAGCFAHPATGRSGSGYTHDAQCVTYQGPDEQYRGREICLGSNETALSIADVTDKDRPRPLASASYPNVAYSHQGWLTDDHRYFYMDDEGDEISGTVSGTRTLIWDVADLDDPVLLAEYVSENRASDHNLYIRDNLMYQSNYVSGLRVLDISDRGRPVPVGHFDTVPWGEDRPGFDGSWSNYPFFKSGVVVVTSGREGVFVLRRKPQTLVP
jgi:choice-of-anchor B domain-containing protein